MEKFIEHAQQIAQKQSHVRSAVSDWLTEWKNQTKDINDSELNRIKVLKSYDPYGFYEIYFLRLGSNYIYKATEDEYNYHYSNGQEIHENYIDMQILRDFFLSLPDALEKHSERFEEEQEVYQTILNTINYG